MSHLTFFACLPLRYSDVDSYWRAGTGEQDEGVACGEHGAIGPVNDKPAKWTSVEVFRGRPHVFSSPSSSRPRHPVTSCQSPCASCHCTTVQTEWGAFATRKVTYAPEADGAAAVGRDVGCGGNSISAYGRRCQDKRTERQGTDETQQQNRYPYVILHLRPPSAVGAGSGSR